MAIYIGAIIKRDDYILSIGSIYLLWYQKIVYIYRVRLFYMRIVVVRSFSYFLFFNE